MNLSSSARYVRMARIVVKLPTYARLVWGLFRDPRTQIGLKGMLAAALAYVVLPVDLIPDVIPVLGQADDLTVLLLVLDLFIQNAPAEHRGPGSRPRAPARADGRPIRSHPRQPPGAAGPIRPSPGSRRAEALAGGVATSPSEPDHHRGGAVKVILKRDVKGLGREGDLKEVKDGYARNHLLPTGAAAVADRGALANWERHRDQREERDRSERARAEATAEKLSELRLEIPVKAGERGRLFGAVTSHQIADAIAQAGVELDRHALHLREPIKALGDYKIDVRIMPGVDAVLNVSVVPET